MNPKKERVSLVVDGRDIPLRTEFANEVVKAVVKALVCTLHGTEGAKRIIITLESEGEGEE